MSDQDPKLINNLYNKHRDKQDYPLRFEIDMQKVIKIITILGALFTSGFWVINAHDKYATKNNVNLIYIDVQIGLAEDKLVTYDEKTTLTEAQKRQYSGIQARLAELQKSRDKIIGLGQK